MCGLAGFTVGRAEDANRQRLQAMTAAISHRGPDDEQFHIDAQIALGFRRLSIIDVESGAQPMSNEDGTIWLVYNGEIYNFQDLRAQLVAKGHIFRSKSDAEVIVHGYEEWGTGVLDRIKGMFGFALWDGPNRRTILCVDRFGIKPLYFAQAGQQLVFASEAKALFASGLVACAADHDCLAYHMTFLTAPFPRTMFKGVAKLRPGHFAVFEGGNLREHCYWDQGFEQEPQTWSKDNPARVHAAIDRAVVGQSRADVPLGSFLSGGLDSSAVCNALVKQGGPTLETYFIGFRTDQLKRDILMDERPYARQMATALGTLHHEIDIGTEGLEDLLPRLVWHMDEPVGDPAAVATFMVSRAARETLTVLLSGVGGDEVFAGYPRHLAMNLMGRFNALPTVARRGIGAIGARLPGGAHALFRNAKKFLRAAQGDPLASYLEMLSYFSPATHRQLFTDDFFDAHCREDVYAYHREFFDRTSGQSMLNRIQYLDLKTFLPCLNLTYSDRMSMAASIEMRVPLLDDDLYAAMRSLPTSLKIRGRQRKYIFKKAMEGHLPDDVIWRRKAGFGAPIQAWLSHELRDMVEHYLGESHLRKQGIFRPAYVAGLLRAQDRREDYLGNHIWQLLVFQLWHEVFVSGSPTTPLAIPRV